MARDWLSEAIRRIEADYNRSADTHLIRVELPRYPGTTLYLKDESSHPTGSLKHRLARSLFLYALCNGWIGRDTCIIESSSGSTAVSEAYFARILGLRFIAVVPASTAAPKLDAIRFHGGEIHAVDDPRTVYAEAHRLAAETGGHYIDQFTYAERATDWRGKQQHRRIDLCADGGGGISRPPLGRLRRGHRGHVRHDRTLHPVSAPRQRIVRRRSGPIPPFTATSPTARSSRCPPVVHRGSKESDGPRSRRASSPTSSTG